MYCPICGCEDLKEHHCSEESLEAIDAANDRAMRREFDEAEKDDTSYDGRLKAGFAMLDFED